MPVLVGSRRSDPQGIDNLQVAAGRNNAPWSATPRPVKITVGEMRAAGTIGILVYCADCKCSHSIAMPADQWGDDSQAL
jgi:hypothetical protein